jgi:hypothetical protein
LISDQTHNVLDIARMSDGLMLGSKTLIAKNASASTALCSAGAMGMEG